MAIKIGNAPCSWGVSGQMTPEPNLDHSAREAIKRDTMASNWDQWVSCPKIRANLVTL